MSLKNGLFVVTDETLVILEQALKDKSDMFFSVIYSAYDFLANISTYDISCLRDLIFPYLFSRTSPSTPKRKDILNGLIESAYDKEKFIMHFLHSKYNA